MNPTRNLLMLLLRIPPQVMLVLVIGLGAFTTWLVTVEMDKNHRSLKDTIADLERKNAEQPKVVYLEKDTQPKEQAPTDFQSVMKQGYRAISIAVDTTNGSTRFMKPGSHVDVMVITGSGTETEATPILSDVEVVAVGANFEKGSSHGAGEPSNTVTVSVTPKDASKILKAQVAGKLYLTLRSDKDRTPLITSDPVRPRAHTGQVIIPAPPATAIAPPVKPFILPQPVKQAAVAPQVETWEGNRKDIVSFSKGAE